MKNPNHSKGKGLGRGFHEFINTAETCERILMNPKESKLDSGVLGYLAEQIFFQLIEHKEYEPAQKYVQEVIERWGNMARDIRSSFKFHSTYDCLINSPIISEGVFRMPFENIMLVVDVPATNEHLDHYTASASSFQYVIFVDERIYNPEETPENNDWYENAGLKPFGLFYSITIGVFRTDGVKTSEGIVPFEIHVPVDCDLQMMPNCYAYPRSTGFTPDFDGVGQSVLRFLVRFVTLINHRAAKLSTRPGLKGGVKHKASKRHKTKYKHYEHTLVVIDPNYVASDEVGPGGMRAHPRLHPVRGFFRHYKTGKVTWIKQHWRGDKDLGVVTHDYEIETRADNSISK